MRKKIFLLILLLLPIYSVKAMTTATSEITNKEKTLLVGESTKFYVKIYSDDMIKEVGFNLLVSNELSITNSTIKVGNNYSQTNRFIIVTDNLVSSGTTFLELDVKCVSGGTGTIDIYDVEVYDKNDSIISGSKSTGSVICHKKTVEETNAEDKVEIAESKLTSETYEEANLLVEDLNDGTIKSDLVNRLEEVKIQIRINDALNANEKRYMLTDLSTLTETGIIYNNKDKWKEFIIGFVVLLVLVITASYIRKKWNE